MAAAINQVTSPQAPSMGKSANAAARDPSPDFGLCFEGALGMARPSGDEAVPESGVETPNDPTPRARRVPSKHRTIDGALNPSDGPLQAATALPIAQLPQIQISDVTASSNAQNPLPQGGSAVPLIDSRSGAELGGKLGPSSDNLSDPRAAKSNATSTAGQAPFSATFGGNDFPPRDLQIEPNGRIFGALPAGGQAAPLPANTASSVIAQPTIDSVQQIVATESALPANPAARSGGTIRELLHRLSAKPDAGEVGIDDADAADSKRNAFLPIGSIPGVAGSLRLEHDSRDAEYASTELPSSAAFGAPSLPSPESRAASPSGAVSIPTPVASPQWAEAFGSAVVQFATTDVGEAKLTLSPDEMGTISVTIGIDGSLVSVGFSTDNQVVRDAVTASLPLLQDMLAKSGLSLSQSSVGRDQSDGTQPPPRPVRIESGATPAAAVDDAGARPVRHRPASDALVDMFA